MDPIPDSKQSPAPAITYPTRANLIVELGGRVPYHLVIPRYQSIATITHDWDEFMSAFFAVFYGHAMLWSVGIQHGDISVTNLMWDPEEKKPKLCDFDLSCSWESPQFGVPGRGPDGPMELSKTGTWIFMADELLTPRAMDGSVKRVYRHDVEAFIAVLVYIVCRHKDGEVRPGRPLEHWNQADYFAVKSKRSRTLREITGSLYPQPSEVADSAWYSARTALSRMHRHKGERAALIGELEELEMRRTRYPDRPFPAPSKTLEDYDDLRLLPKEMLTWPLFTDDPSAEPFAKLIKECILNPSAARGESLNPLNAHCSSYGSF